MKRNSRHRRRIKEGKNSVRVIQKTRASTGQDGNAFAINGSDVGVIRTDIAPGGRN